MSSYEQNILDLHSIYISHPELFGPNMRESLAEVVSDLSEKDSIKDISIAIARWIENQPDILDAFLDLPNSDEKEMGPNRTKLLSTSKTLNLLHEVISAPIKDTQDDSISQADPSLAVIKTDNGSGSDATDSSARA